MMIRRTSNKKKKNGFSLIELLVVLAITGFTLIALVDLAARDLMVESINEQLDTANYMDLAQMEDFDNIVSQNNACVQYLASSPGTYNACGNISSPPIQSCSSQTWNLKSGSYTYVAPDSNLNNAYDCSSSSNQGTQDAAAGGVYKEELQVTNHPGSPGYITVISSVSLVASNGSTYPFSLTKNYYY